MESATAQCISAPKVFSGSSQLDSIETTTIRNLPNCYAEVRRSKYREDFQAAEQLYEDLDHEDGKNRLSQLRECRQYAYFARHKESGKVRVISNSCRLRWCPVCAAIKRIRIADSVSEWLHHISRPKFITLTMSHVSVPVTDQIRHLYRAFRLIRQHKAIRQAMRGGVWFFQIKRAQGDNFWHPHLHIVADSDYIDKRLLSIEWLRSTGNSYIVDIREVKNVKEVSDYVSRYCSQPCKIAQFNKTDRFEIANLLHGKRLCGRFGTGNKCDFKVQRPKEASEWQRLGSWHNFIVNRPFDRSIQRIIEAWVLDESVGYDICQDFIREENPEPAIVPTRVLEVRQRQLVIEEFVHR